MVDLVVATYLAATSLPNGLFAGLSAISLALTVVVSYFVYRADRESRVQRASQAAEGRQADLIRAEHEGWEVLLQNLRTEYGLSMEKLHTTERRLEDANLQLSQARVRLGELETRANHTQALLERATSELAETRIRLKGLEDQVNGRN